MLKPHRAIVIGAGIAGLAAARVLAQSFRQVIVLEQDDPPSSEHGRRYVPQSFHAHYLQTGGLQAVEQLFPGFISEMQEMGTRKITPSTDLRIFIHGNWIAPCISDMEAYPQTRPQLEHHLYNRVRGIENIDIRHHMRVKKLLWRSDLHAVYGVEVGNGEMLQADLVVDTCGRSSHMAHWLQEAGYPIPQTDEIKMNLSYADCTYRLLPGKNLPATFHLQIDWANHSARGGYIFALDQEHFIILLTGVQSDHPPADQKQFLEFAKSLPLDNVAKALEVLEPIGKIELANFTSSRWNRFDKLSRHPLGLLTLGDSICSVDPRFGSGMSMALQQVCLLQMLLQKSIAPQHLAPLFYRKTRLVIESPWLLIASEDFRISGVTGNPPKNLRLMQHYVDWVLQAATYDKKIALIFYQVFFLTRRYTALLMPYIVLRVVFDHFFRNRRHSVTIS